MTRTACAESDGKNVPMRRGERAELQRQGAKAAARGDDPRANPLLLTRNLPASTGESQQQWSFRRDAWQTGYESQRIARHRHFAAG